MNQASQKTLDSSSTLRHFAGIDGLRAIAVLAVLVFHLHAGWLPGGFVGVDIFFVISGFVVTHSMASMRFSSFKSLVAHFYARRLLRIAPALLLCLLVVTVLSCMFIPKAWLSQVNSRTGLSAFFGASNFVLAGAANDYFSPRSDFNPFTHTWSLGVEEQFYLLFPFFMYALIGKSWKENWKKQISSIALIVLGLVSLAFCAAWSREKANYAFYLLPSRFWELALGVGLIFSWPLLNQRLSRLGSTFTFISSIVFVLMLGISLGMADESAFPYPWAMLPTLGTVGLLCILVSNPDAFVTRVLSTWPLRQIGKISYSLYLWHWPVFVLFRWTVGLEEAHFKLSAIAFAFVFAVISFEFIEKPIRKSTRIATYPKYQVAWMGVAITGVTCLLALVMFLNQNSLSLSVTRDVNSWNPESEIQLPGIEPNCKVVSVEDTSPSREGVVRQLLPTDCKQARPTTKLFVAGDSHAWAYTTMLRLHAQQTGQEVVLITRGGCPFFNLIRLNNAESKFCGEFTSKGLRVIANEAQEGDVLFLPSLRLPRLADQWGSNQKSGGGSSVNAGGDDRRTMAVAEAISALKPISDKGVRIVFEAPKPIFRAAAFRCSDWFNASNPACRGGLSIARDEVDQLREPSLQAMGEVNRRLLNASVWDPLPLLCPNKVCEAKLGANPLFFDGDHISGFAKGVST
jgi:peptidoglycan/LPS O-acetylase OafA/YrhL